MLKKIDYRPLKKTVTLSFSSDLTAIRLFNELVTRHPEADWAMILNDLDAASGDLSGAGAPISDTTINTDNSQTPAKQLDLEHFIALGEKL
jgi:hypothetical protein